MPLPEPTTRSPGSIRLVYSRNNDGAQRHTSGVRLLAGVSITDLTAMRAEAQLFGAALRNSLTPALTVLAWRLADPAGVTLYEEAFAPTLAGNRATDSGDLLSESTTHTFVGKASAGTIGQAAGSTRTVVYRGSWRNDTDANPTTPAAFDNGDSVMLSYLNGSTVTGADFYGQKAGYKPNVNVQINAHWQRRYGF